ncbi:hypothetical protein DFJ74DRAFT_645947 [Hyaloraphidium curvatum]|nr:hypothetical protein DFJ74DRAFT_645947 [Hyaloraphidium curvatum]
MDMESAVAAARETPAAPPADDPDAPRGSRARVDAVAEKVAEVDPELAQEVSHIVEHHQAAKIEEEFGTLGGEVAFIDHATDPVANPELLARTTSPAAADGGEKEEQDEEPVSVFRVIFSTPRIKQYFRSGKLHRSPEHRKTSFLELFFDLIFVTIVARLGAHFATAPSWTRLSDFFMLLAPIFRTMADFNIYHDIFASDDIVSNIVTAWIAGCVIGMGVTASAALPFGTGRAYVAFYLISRCTWIAVYSIYMILFPRFRASLLLTVISILLPSLLSSPTATTPSCRRCGGRHLFSILPSTPRWSSACAAINIEHTTERMGLFVILALGEFVVALIFDYPVFEGFLYAKAVLGLLTAMCLQWMDRGTTYASYHSVARRIEIRAADDKEPKKYMTADYAWSFCGSMAASYFSFFLLSFTHIYPESDALVPGWARKLAGLVVVLTFALLPLAYAEMTSLELMIGVASVSAALVVFEMFAKVRAGKRARAPSLRKRPLRDAPPIAMATPQRVLGTVFLGMGLGTMFAPQDTLIPLCFKPDFLGPAGASPPLKLVMQCFGSQASLVGLLLLTTKMTKTSYKAFGIAMIPYIVFDYMFWRRGALTNFGAAGDFAGNLIFITCCYLGYQEAEEE